MTGTDTSQGLSLGPGGCGRHRRRESQAAGSVTTSRSPSSATSPPSARTILTATEAPRSLGILAEHDRGRVRDDRLDRDLAARDDRRDLDAAMTRGRAREPCERALERERRPPERSRPHPWRRERQPARARASRPAQHRLVASTLDPGRDREEVEQLDELVACRIDDPEVAGGRLADVLADQRLREALDRREQASAGRGRRGRRDGRSPRTPVASVTGWPGRQTCSPRISRRRRPRSVSR